MLVESTLFSLQPLPCSPTWKQTQQRTSTGGSAVLGAAGDSGRPARAGSPGLEVTGLWHEPEVGLRRDR